MFTLQGRTALVSGPTGVIGSAVVRRFLEAGMNVVLMSDLVEKSTALANQLTEFGDRVYPSKAGMREPEYCRENIRKIYEHFGSIDVLAILNGTEPEPSNVEDVDMGRFMDCMDTHLKAPIMFLKTLIPYLEKSKAPRIILTSCMESESGAQEAGIAFTVAKGGVISMTKAAAQELAPKGITVNCVAIGGLYNVNQLKLDAMTASVSKIDLSEKDWSIPRNSSPLGRMCTPNDVAAAYEFLASEEAGFITGEILNVNGGMYMC